MTCSTFKNDCENQWIDKTKGLFQCQLCGRTKTTRQTDLKCVHHPCPKKTGKDFSNFQRSTNNNAPRRPSAVRRLKNFSKAAIAHHTKGSPTCEQDEIDRRLAICKDCPLFAATDDDTGVCTHPDCGCNLKRERVYLNKLAWADQKCPIDKWGPIKPKDGV